MVRYRINILSIIPYRMDFQGPADYIESTNVFRNRKRCSILDASIEYRGDVLPIGENHLFVERKTNDFYIYHWFKYLTYDGSKVECGRWSNARFPLNSFRDMSGNVLRVTIDSYTHIGEYQSSVAICTIVFTRQAANELRSIA